MEHGNWGVQKQLLKSKYQYLRDNLRSVVMCAVGLRAVPIFRIVTQQSISPFCFAYKRQIFRVGGVLCTLSTFIVLGHVYTGRIAGRAFSVGLRKKKARRQET